MTTTAREFGWGALAAWIGVTTLGWGVGLLPAMASISGVFFSGTTDEGPNIVVGLLTLVCGCGGFCFLSAIPVAAMQWWVLNRNLSDQTEGWFAASIGGGGIGWVLGWVANFGVFALGNFSGSKDIHWTVGSLAVGAILGLVLGIIQARILRRVVPHAPRWIGASILSWTAGLLVYWMVYRLAGGPFTTVVSSYYEGGIWPKTLDAPGAGPAILIAWIAGGLVVGTITGFTMKRLLKGATAPHYQPLTPNP